MRDLASVDIVGAGPTGALLAILLQRRGLKVTLYEARKDPRDNPANRAGPSTLRWPIAACTPSTWRGCRTIWPERW